MTAPLSYDMIRGQPPPPFFFSHHRSRQLPLRSSWTTVGTFFQTEASLKKDSVSGGPAGCLKKVRLGFFFHFCKKNLFISQKWTILPPPPPQKKKKKKKNCGRPTDHNYGHPLDRKQTIFVDSLSIRLAPSLRSCVGFAHQTFTKHIPPPIISGLTHSQNLSSQPRVRKSGGNPGGNLPKYS